MTAFIPSRDELQTARSQGHRKAVVAASLITDGDTPLSLFARLVRDEGGRFLFESVEGGERTGRWSFFGSGLQPALQLDAGKLSREGGGQDSPPQASETTGEELLAAIRSALAEDEAWVAPGLPPFTGGLVGAFAFEALATFEPVPSPPRAIADDWPDVDLLRADAPFAYDHATHRLHALGTVDLTASDVESELATVRERLEARLLRFSSEPVRLLPFSPENADPDAVPRHAHRSPENFEEAVRAAKEAIKAGEVFQVVLSQRWSVDVSVEPFTLYRALRALNPSPYMFLVQRSDGRALVGASPEVLVRVDEGEVAVRPIAGTRRRGRTTAEDLSLEHELLADEKERAEHTMLLDLGRNDVGRVARPGTVRVEAPMHVERYAHVMHLVSDVFGTLAADKDACDAFRAGFPAGTVVGAPKIRAAELVAELEPHRRGFYAGAVGYFDRAGSMDTCIAIRTLAVYPDRVDVQAGAGIVHDSDPAREHEECVNKARSPFAAVALALAGGRSALASARSEGPEPGGQA
ncbi:MAG: anthranilate synthase component I family protein [Myxococcota bacterium]